MIRSTPALLAAVFLAGPVIKTANGQSLTDTDAKVAQVLREHPDSGILFIDVMMRNEKATPMGCGTTTLTLVGMDKKNVRIRTHIGSLFGKSDLDGGIGKIEPGLYLVGGVTCELAGTQLYRGNFAKITIRPGEIVTAGTLVIDYKIESSFFKRKFSGSSHVEDFSPKTLASLKQQAPVTLAKAKKGSLIVLNDREKKVGLTPPKR